MLVLHSLHFKLLAVVRGINHAWLKTLGPVGLLFVVSVMIRGWSKLTPFRHFIVFQHIFS